MTPATTPKKTPFPFFVLALVSWSGVAGAADRYHSDSDARFVHHIDLYDTDNRKITAESTKPYSSKNTCGRCHEYETIAHGWHFNAFNKESVDGRRGEPWIWTDPRTGTQLPLSYRDWLGMTQPSEVGLSAWEMTRQFGGRIPGGGLGQAGADATDDSPAENRDADVPEGDEEVPPQRWAFSGDLEIDCMACHAVSSAFDFNARREQIADENFAWAATAALRLGEISGRVSSIKDGSDPDDEAVQKKLPKVTYDARRFHPDGTVFMDLIRKPSTNACYQCHSQRAVTDQGIEPRWVHDDDIHIRAGMDCADCHRNGIDHHIVRGFDGEANPSGVKVETLSCSGCHLGSRNEEPDSKSANEIQQRPGRLGSPKPLHAGLPPLHFEKLTCTACHGGPLPRPQAIGILTSLAHGLGEKGHRTGQELPNIAGPIFTKGSDGRIGPHRAMWPAFWGKVENESVTPISPAKIYDITRRALRVRKDFVAEILQPKLSRTDLKELLGDEAAAQDPEEWTDEQKAKVDEATEKEGRSAFNEKVHSALAAIEEEFGITQAAYVSAGNIYVRGDDEGELKSLSPPNTEATEMVTWPIAHNVRPAGWSLGANGCTECHSEEGLIFTSTVSAIGPGPDRGPEVAMTRFQGVDEDQRLAWNELFKGRKDFKFIVGGSLLILLLVMASGIGAGAARLVTRTK